MDTLSSIYDLGSIFQDAGHFPFYGDKEGQEKEMERIALANKPWLK